MLGKHHLWSLLCCSSLHLGWHRLLVWRLGRCLTHCFSKFLLRIFILSALYLFLSSSLGCFVFLKSDLRISICVFVRFKNPLWYGEICFEKKISAACLPFEKKECMISEGQRPASNSRKGGGPLGVRVGKFFVRSLVFKSPQANRGQGWHGFKSMIEKRDLFRPLFASKRAFLEAPGGDFSPILPDTAGPSALLVAVGRNIPTHSYE